jgi:hypothetical protein
VAGGWWRGGPGERGESHTRTRPATVVSRVNGYPWARGTQRSWRAAVRWGVDEPRASAHLPGSAVGAARRAVTHSQPEGRISRPLK